MKKKKKYVGEYLIFIGDEMQFIGAEHTYAMVRGKGSKTMYLYNFVLGINSIKILKN